MGFKDFLISLFQKKILKSHESFNPCKKSLNISNLKSTKK